MSVFSAVPSEGRKAIPTWMCVLLGIVFVLAGFVVLGDVVLATIVSTVIIGVAAVAAGIFELVHAFWTKGWGGFVWQIVLGLLYIVGGVALLTQPVAGSVLLTWVLGFVLLASGIVRILVGFGRWAEAGWVLVISGLFGIGAGFVILSGWPMTGLWVLGFLLGVDLVLHGVGWLVTAVTPAGRRVTT
jgi:uncharacterized membrane protein HdeD (DUF308 family)